jgi:hypothetical protein
MSHPRNTRSSSKKAVGIGENFLSLAQGSSTLSAVPPTLAQQRSPSAASDYILPSVRNASGEDNQGDAGENFLPTDRNEPPLDDRDHDSDGGNSSGSDEPAPQPDQTLANTLKLLADKIGDMSQPRPSKSKVQQRVPDVFDGTDPAKLDTFVFQVSMYMACRDTDFPDQESRVTFALSYLKGVPLDWFQGEVSRVMTDGENLSAWFSSYPAFTAELHRLFGPRDPVNDATNALEALKYKDSTKAARYIIEFNRHAHRTGWNDTALARQFYKGLPDRLKDEIARLGKPAGLTPLQELVATLDQRYWERQSEISRDKRSANNSNATTSQNKPTSSDNRNDRNNNTNANGAKNGQQQPKNKDQKKPQPAANASGSGNKTNTISDLLGPDGKLKPEERQRRMDNNLCLRCGKPGHKVSECPVVAKAKPKGRAAAVTPSVAAPAANASGKA